MKNFRVFTSHEYCRQDQIAKCSVMAEQISTFGYLAVKLNPVLGRTLKQEISDLRFFGDSGMGKLT
jgi:hypothetical protein